MTTRRKKLNAKGSPDWRTTGFIGIGTAEHGLYREELAAIQAEARDHYIEVGQEEGELLAA